MRLSIHDSAFVECDVIFEFLAIENQEESFLFDDTFAECFAESETKLHE